MATYSLSQDVDPEAERLRLERIQQYQDQPTIRYLERIGVAAGWHCMDVGAGAGSIARWLAERVGPTGSVLATDLETGMLHGAANLTVKRHDIRTDEMPDQEFDLVHARLLLDHLPDRDAVLERMVHATRPGGRVMLGDIDFRTLQLSHDDPEFGRIKDIFLATTRDTGWDPGLGPATPGMLEDSGLADVEAECWQSYHRGSGPAPQILIATFQRLRPAMLAHGATAEQLDRACALLADPKTGFYGPTIWTAWGTRQ